METRIPVRKKERPGDGVAAPSLVLQVPKGLGGMSTLADALPASAGSLCGTEHKRAFPHYVCQRTVCPGGHGYKCAWMAIEDLVNRTQMQVTVLSDDDLVTARREGRLMAGQLGFSASEATLVATAIAELARNMVVHARHGEIRLGAVNDSRRRGITIVARDQGVGICGAKRAPQAGYPAGAGLGLGLPGVKRLMDEFDIACETGRGTTITATKWRPQ